MATKVSENIVSEKLPKLSNFLISIQTFSNSDFYALSHKSQCVRCKSQWQQGMLWFRLAHPSHGKTVEECAAFHA